MGWGALASRSASSAAARRVQCCNNSSMRRLNKGARMHACIHTRTHTWQTLQSVLLFLFTAPPP